MIVVWTNLAINQRNKLFAYWNKRNKSILYSKRLNLLIYEKINLIQCHLSKIAGSRLTKSFSLLQSYKQTDE